MFRSDLRPHYYFFTVFGMSGGSCILIPFMLGNGFDYAVWIAMPIFAIATCFTAGFGVAEALQDYFDARKLRKQAENFLYDQTSFHSEGGY
jgi:hypothetical protein